jgi:tetratricopeptide (TPR) repeat protein
VSDDFGFRRIETVEDAEQALSYPKLSFEQCMECIQVLQEAGQWRLHHLASERVVEEGFGVTRRSITPIKVIRAAREILNAYLEQAEELDELADSVRAAQLWTEKLSEIGSFDPVTGEYLDGTREDINKLLLLVNRSTLPCFTPMARLLRKFDRPDLAIQAATRHLDEEPDDIAALTTRGAAHTDLGHLHDATRDHQRGYEIKPDSSYLLNAFSRTRQEDGRLEEALELARRAFEIDQSRFTARRLISAARAMRDAGAAEEALRILESLPDSASGPGVDQMLVALAALVHMRMGRLEEVEAYLRVVLNEEIILHETQQIIDELKAAVEDEHNRRQGRLDLGDETGGGIEHDEGDEHEDLEPF